MYEIQEEYTNTIIEMKSKFIAYFIPFHDVESFKQRLKLIEKEHHKARHVVYAYRIGNSAKSTDNGEPKHTAGRPLLDLLMKKDINNAAIIVVRYFGGTLLGAGRLLRTYLNSGVEVVKKAGL